MKEGLQVESRTLLPSRYAPHFDIRLQHDLDLESQIKEGTAQEFEYCNFLGEYGRLLEMYFALHVKELLDLKKQDPVIVLDIGGSLGNSWIKIASEFEHEIAEGKVAFVVSNLKQTPEEIAALHRLDIQTRFKRMQNGISDGLGEGYYVQDDTKLMQIQNELPARRRKVHYISGSLADLPNTFIRLTDGRSVCLENNVDLLHESYSVTAWGMVPEITLLSIENIASIHARYFLPKQDTHNLQTDLIDEDENVREGIEIAHEDLQKNFAFIREEHPLLHNNDGRKSPYICFRRL